VNKRRSIQDRRFIRPCPTVPAILCLVLLFGMFFTAFGGQAEAKTVRAAIIEDLSGIVKIRKAGGAKSFNAFKNMSLNHGDQLITEKDSSVVLIISDQGDEITIGENAHLNIDDLSDKGTNKKKTKFKIWAGSMWMKVQSLLNTDDQFEVETPTAVMGVRGTHFFVSVDQRKETTVMVGSGAVSVESIVPGKDGTQSEKTVLLLPTQQLNLDSRVEVDDFETKVSIVKVDQIVKSASPAVIEAIVRSKEGMDQENIAFLKKVEKQIETGNITYKRVEKYVSSLEIKNLNELNKVVKNAFNIAGNIAYTAISEKKITKEKMVSIIKDVNSEVPDVNREIYLDQVEKIDPTAGVDPNLYNQKQQELQRLELLKQQQLEEETRLQQEKQLLYDQLLTEMSEQNQLSQYNSISVASSVTVTAGGMQSLSVNTSLPDAMVTATTSDASVASVSVTDRTLTIVGRGVGSATITVIARKDGYPDAVATITVYAVENQVRVTVPILQSVPLTFTGMIKVDLGSLFIPQGATVQVEPVTADLSGTELTAAGTIAKFTFTGITVNEPVLISFPVKAGVDITKVGIFYKNGDIWEYQPSTVINGIAYAWVNHFSTYGVLEAGKAATPTANPAAGLVSAGTSVELTSTTSGTKIYYTLDGNAPTTKSLLYDPNNKPVVPSEGLTINALAYKDGMINSNIATFIYTVQSDTQAVADAKAALTDSSILATNISLDTVTEDLNLYTSGASGTSIQWASSDQTVIEIDGDVHRPSYIEGDAIVTLTATITKGTASDTKTFTVTVLKLPQSDAEAVTEAKEDLTGDSILGTNLSLDTVTDNLNLYTSGSEDTTIQWASSDDSVIATNGTVHRPGFLEGDAIITLTATISKGSVSDSKTFTVTVLKLSISDLEAVVDALNLLTESYIQKLNNLYLTDVTIDLMLPTTIGSYGVSISWNSENLAHLESNGKVKRPLFGKGDTEPILLTATVTKGIEKGSKEFRVTVKQLDPDPLSITSECSSDPTLRKWSISNPNKADVTFSWKLRDGTGAVVQEGSSTVKLNNSLTISTTTVTGDNILEIYVFGKKHDEELSTGTTCTTKGGPKK
jgi:hypothetical protein